MWKSSRQRSLFVAVPIVLGVSWIAGVQLPRSTSDEIMFGTTELKLGMEERALLERLGQSYRLVNTGPGNWAVLQRDPSLPGVGSIAFAAGRLSYVNRTWVQAPGSGSDAGDPVAVARAFHAVVSQFVKEGRSACTIGTYDSIQPQGEGRTAYLVCGRKEIRVFLVRESRWGWVATVEEVMPGVR